jgi:hypothetical protein
MFTRWLTISVVAIGLGVAALELSACLAVEPRVTDGRPSTSLFTDAVEPDLPIGAETEANEASALPRFTQ